MMSKYSLLLTLIAIVGGATSANGYDKSSQ